MADTREQHATQPAWICQKCRQPLSEIRYPSDSMLNRDQWESQLPGDLFCTCHNNHKGNKPYAYFWKSELAESPAPEVPTDETGWLIEKGQLCLGSCDRKPAWVTFTDPSAVRFSRRVDAENMLNSLRSMSDKGAFEQCTINDHMWVNA